MTSLRDETAQVTAHWNYADVIALVTAYLPEERLNGDRGAWLRGIAELAEAHPEYFRRVHFVRRDPLPPYSREVDEVLKMLGKWEYQGSFNPRFRVIALPQAAKTELKSSVEPKFQQSELQQIRAMSQQLANHVKLEDEAGDVGGTPTAPSGN